MVQLALSLALCWVLAVGSGYGHNHGVYTKEEDEVYTYGLSCMEPDTPCQDSTMCPGGYFCANAHSGLCCEGELGPCTEMLAGLIGYPPVMDDVPSCRLDGYFQAAQHHYFGESYCVTASGTWIVGSNMPSSEFDESMCLDYFTCPFETDEPLTACPSNGECGEGEYCYAHRTCCRGERDTCVQLVEEAVDAGLPSLPGSFVHQCESDGTCSSTQCHGSTGYCWCSSPGCEEVEGTRVPAIRDGTLDALQELCDSTTE